MSAGIPAGIDGITPEWLAAATGWDITAVSVEQIGVGVGVSSAVYRATITSTTGPVSVIVKLAALDPAAQFTSTVLSMYRREVLFFEKLGSESPVRVPNSFYGEVNDDGSQFVVVMEDLAGNRICDQVSGMAIEDAERAIDSLAAWHAKFWNKVDGLAESGTAVPLGSPMYPAMLPFLFDEGWAILTASESCQPPSELLSVGPKFGAAIGGLLADLDKDPVTVLHGDYRADNIMFDPSGSPILIDFQLTGTGSAAYDLAYFITQSLTAETASANEQALFERWKAGVIAGGVPEADLAGIWENYRKAALFCLVYPVVASRGMDLTDARSRDLLNTMQSRLGRATRELDLASLI